MISLFPQPDKDKLNSTKFNKQTGGENDKEKFYFSLEVVSVLEPHYSCCEMVERWVLFLYILEREWVREWCGRTTQRTGVLFYFVFYETSENDD